MKDNSETKNYPIQRNGGSSPRRTPQRRRRRNARRTFLIVLIVILLSIVAVALFFVVRDIINAEREKRASSGTVTTEAEVTTAPAAETESPSVAHPASLAIDGDDSTYMLSEDNQQVGAYVTVDLGKTAEITSVRIVSNSATEYIREADIQISADGVNWSYYGQYSGSASSPDAKTVTTGVAVSAAYVRIMLTEKADEKWVLNSVYVDTADSGTLTLKSAEYGTGGGSSYVVTTGGETTAEVTTAPAAGYTTITKKNAEIYTGNLILVNNKHQYSFPTSTADILPMFSNRPEVVVGGKSVMAYKVGGSSLPALKSEALEAFNSLATAFVNETGITQMEIGENDAWRSYDTQNALYIKYPTSASKAGYSEHNTGLGLNIQLMDDSTRIYALNDTTNANGAKTYTWLTSNAYKFGFVERFKTAKKTLTGVTDNYHYRYVGVGHAYYMWSNNLCLEEYIELLHTYTYEGTHLTFTDDGVSYEIYYVPYNTKGQTTELPVPADKTVSYTVSGDNYSGFIVTIAK